MLASDIISDARDILSDQSKERWSDNRLLALLNDVIALTNMSTILFAETVFYVVQDLIVDIELFEYSSKILRAEYLDEALPFYSFEEMDKKFGSLWQHVEGDKVLALVYDKQRRGLLKQYPIVKNAINNYITYSSNYGIITKISYSDILPVVTGNYGDLSSIPNEALIKFYHIRKHARITALTDTINADEVARSPFAHYIAGMALRDNQDTQSRAMATDELAIYESMISEFNLETSLSFKRSSYEVRYNPL